MGIRVGARHPHPYRSPNGEKPLRYRALLVRHFLPAAAGYPSFSASRSPLDRYRWRLRFEDSYCRLNPSYRRVAWVMLLSSADPKLG